MFLWLKILDLNQKFETKITEQGAVGAGEGFTLLILNQDIGDFIKLVRMLEISGLLNDDVIETVKHEINKNINITY